jgi:hypothetical protein
MAVINSSEVPLIKKDIQIMSESIKALKDDLEKHFSDEAKRHDDFLLFKEDLFEKLETKFASKWVERSMVAIFSAI